MAERLGRLADRCVDAQGVAAALLARARLRDRMARISRQAEDLRCARIAWAQVIAGAQGPEDLARALARSADLALSFDRRAEGVALLRRLAQVEGGGRAAAEARQALELLAPLVPARPAAGPRSHGAHPPRRRRTAGRYAGQVLSPEQVGIRLPATPGRTRSLVRIRRWSARGFSRVVVWFDGPVRYDHGLLLPAAGRPARLFLDFAGAVLARRMARLPSAGPAHLIRALRLANRPPVGARLVLDLGAPCRFFVYPLEHPYRVVVDLRPAASMPARAALPAVRAVALDPGHGGRQRGAVGPTGLAEKEVTLDIARAAAARLRSAGLRVVLTRDRDETVSLEERTAIALSAGADLFVSIHANAEPSGRQTGLETYVLDVESDEYAARIAARENRLAGRQITGYRLALAQMATRALTSESRRLAGPVHAALLRAARRFRKGLPDRGIRQAIFYVLLTARMPGLLTEVSFLSSRAGEAALRQAEYRAALGEAIAQGVLAYARTRARGQRSPAGATWMGGTAPGGRPGQNAARGAPRRPGGRPHLEIRLSGSGRPRRRARPHLEIRLSRPVPSRR